MKPTEIGAAYDKIASWWSDELQESTRGLSYVERAIGLCGERRKALDVGCGTGGRIATAFLNAGFDVTGIDLSQAMLKIAGEKHPGVHFVLADVCEWEPPCIFDMIVAWDSLIHVPHQMQGDVTRKLCGSLEDRGVILITVGGMDGVVMGTMRGETFYHSSLNEDEYLKIMKSMGCRCVLLERDQFPEEHVVIIGIKDCRSPRNAPDFISSGACTRVDALACANSPGARSSGLQTRATCRRPTGTPDPERERSALPPAAAALSPPCLQPGQTGSASVC
jgi:SAM-dependent methyltransferase